MSPAPADELSGSPMDITPDTGASNPIDSPIPAAGKVADTPSVTPGVLTAEIITPVIAAALTHTAAVDIVSEIHGSGRLVDASVAAQFPRFKFSVPFAAQYDTPVFRTKKKGAEVHYIKNARPLFKTAVSHYFFKLAMINMWPSHLEQHSMVAEAWAAAIAEEGLAPYELTKAISTMVSLAHIYVNVFAY